MRITLTRIVAAIAASLQITAASAEPATIYKSVDANGNLIFSDTPPEGNVKATEVIEITTTEAVSEESYRQRLDEMRETTDRMIAQRRERERLRAEQRQTAASAQPLPPVVEAQEDTRWQDSRFYPIPVYYPYPRFHQSRRDYYPRPPRNHSESGIVPGNNAQLMRPILPRGDSSQRAD